jgi:hypothetical protein
MSQARTARPEFTLRRFPLTINVTGTGTGSVTSEPPGISCTLTAGNPGGDCEESYVDGSIVTLTAAAGANNTFTGWSGEGCSGTAPCTVTMSVARTVSASFAPQTHALTIVGEGTGAGQVTSDPGDISCSINGGAASGTCSDGYAANTVVTLMATPNANSLFSGWSGVCTGTGTCQVTMSQAREVTAIFTLRTFPLTINGLGNGTGQVTSQPAGISCTITAGVPAPTGCTVNFVVGTQVVLTATPTAPNTFGGWTNACNGSSATCTVTVDQARTATARFDAPVPEFTLNVGGDGSGTGTVTSSPAGITCTITAGTPGGDCTESFPSGTTVTLSATPQGSSVFASWGGACSGGSCQLAMTQNHNAIATFDLPNHLLTVLGAGSGSGRITSQPSGIDCLVAAGVTSGTCALPFAAGTSVTLTAVADAGSGIGGWTDACETSGATCTVTMTGPRTARATFTALPKTLDVSLSGLGEGTVTSSPAGINCTILLEVVTGACSHSFPHGTSVTLTASHVPLVSSFGGWGGACSGTSTTCTLTMTVTRSVTARFNLLASNPEPETGSIPEGSAATPPTRPRPRR